MDMKDVVEVAVAVAVAVTEATVTEVTAKNITSSGQITIGALAFQMKMPKMGASLNQQRCSETSSVPETSTS